MLTADEADVRVERGAALLDEKRPGWERRINLKRLNLGSSCFCVLGQLEGSYRNAAKELCGEEYRGKALISGNRFGFSSVFSGTPDAKRRRQEYEALTAAWNRLIARRLAALEPVCLPAPLKSTVPQQHLALAK